jgi:xanthine dehydrogenase YagR molybdenum-binding subunit
VIGSDEAPKTAIPLATDAWVTGERVDPLIDHSVGLIGSPVSRLDGPAKVTGVARFAAEVPLPGLVYAALTYSTIPRGRIVNLETRLAEAAFGVVLVMTHRNAPRMNPPRRVGTSLKAASVDDLPVMQDNLVHWNGQPIALVLADTQEQANYAASLIRATYEEAESATAFDVAKARTHDARLPHGGRLGQEHGDAERALAGARHKVDLLYRTPRHNHNAIEMHAATLVWEGDKLTVHDSTMGVAHQAWTLAEIFGIEERQVHVISPYVGGSFGGKKLWQHHVLGAAAARLSGRAVRIVLSRKGVYRVVGGRTTTEQRAAIGARSDGHFEALIHTGTVAMSPHNILPAEPFIMASQCLYATDNLKLDVQVADMNMVANCFMRGPGEAVGTFALETAVDELAEQIGIDPIELRIRNEPVVDPSSSKPFSSRHLVDAFRIGAEKFGWNRRDPNPGSRREGGWLVGIGCAAATYPYVRFPGSGARITLTRDGRVRVEVPAQEVGTGTVTAQTQVIAERLGLPMEKVTFLCGDSAYPGAVLAAGSNQTAAIGAAVISAQQVLVTELLELAGEGSPLAGIRLNEVGMVDGGLCALHDRTRYESYTSILARAERDELTIEAIAPPPYEEQQWSMHSFGANFCEVRVNAVTGEIRVSRFLGSYDCGRILNPKNAASQFRGGIIMGLGLALMEETHFDERNGRIMNPSLVDYHVPVHMDIPDIDVVWIEVPDPHAPMGARGIGEIGITGVGAAVANAVYNATGKRVRDLPITLDKLLDVLPDLANR